MFRTVVCTSAAALAFTAAHADTVQFSTTVDVVQEITTLNGHPDYQDPNPFLEGLDKFIFFDEHVRILTEEAEVWDPTQIPTQPTPGGEDPQRDYTIYSTGTITGTWTVDTSVFDGVNLLDGSFDYVAPVNEDDPIGTQVGGWTSEVSTFAITTPTGSLGTYLTDTTRIVAANNLSQDGFTFDVLAIQAANLADGATSADGGPAWATLIIAGPDNWFEANKAPDFENVEIQLAFFEYESETRSSSNDPLYDELITGEVVNEISLKNFGAADGSSESAPLLPDGLTEDGGFAFSAIGTSELEGFIFVDPEIAVGYTYVLQNGGVVTGFKAPTDPTLVNTGTGEYTLLIPGMDPITLGVGEEVFFDPADQITTLQVLGINEDLMLDPSDTTTFVAGFLFEDVTPESVLTQTPIVIDTDAQISPVPVPPAAALMLVGLTAFGALRRRKAQVKSAA